MTRSIVVMIVLFLLLAVTACAPPAATPAEETNTAPAPATATAPATSAPTVAATATVTPDAYPAAPTSAPADAGYPAAPALLSPPTAYPVDLQIWILRPLGNQCAEPDSYRYPSREEAVAALEQAGVEVFASETVDLAVCEGCDCPTSQHFRVQILRQDLVAARTLGWYEES